MDGKGISLGDCMYCVCGREIYDKPVHCCVCGRKWIWKIRSRRYVFAGWCECQSKTSDVSVEKG